MHTNSRLSDLKIIVRVLETLCVHPMILKRTVKSISGLQRNKHLIPS